MRPMRLFSLSLLAVAQIAFALSAALVSGGADAQSPTLNRIKATGTITFGYRNNAVPFSYRDRDGPVKGYSVELCTRVAGSIQKELGMSELKIEWLPVEASNRLDYVISGKVDAVCGTTTMTLSRMERVDFSVPIFVDGGALAVRTQSPVQRLADLKDRRVAVIAGTTTERALIAALGVAGAKATVVNVAKPEEGAAALREGRVDAYAGDRIVLTQIMLRSADALAVLPDDFSLEPYAIMVPRDDPDFRLAVNRALVAMYKRGDIDSVYQQWLAALGRPSPLLNAMFYLNALPD